MQAALEEIKAVVVDLNIKAQHLMQLPCSHLVTTEYVNNKKDMPTTTDNYWARDYT